MRFGGRAELGLVRDTHPAVVLAPGFVAAGDDGVGENEKLGVVLTAAEPFDEQVVLVVKHGFQTVSRDVAFRLSVDGVRNDHVVSRDGFGDGTRGPTRLKKKPPHHLLSGPDLGKRSVFARVQVDLESFLLRPRPFFRLPSLPPTRWPKLNVGQPQGRLLNLRLRLLYGLSRDFAKITCAFGSAGRNAPVCSKHRRSHFGSHAGTVYA